MNNDLGATYWNARYQDNRTGWDVGYPSTPLKEYIDQLANKDSSILVPGGGNGYEAEYLMYKGFKNVIVVDLSPKAKENFMHRVPHFPAERFLVHDFFKVEGAFDLILEQTFFCALDPSLREAYAQKMAALLKPKGKLVGLFFDFPLDSGPPFGGSIQEYHGYFKPYFTIEVLERCYNSIPPRQGKELFFKFVVEQ